MTNNLINNLKIVFVVFAFVALIIPFIKKMAIHINAVDIPGGRHIHEKLMPIHGKSR